jgi:glycosyltransferase involved in cell wall biosynthesis
MGRLVTNQLTSMRIVLFTSQILNALDYARGFSGISHTVAILILVPKRMRNYYYSSMASFGNVYSSNVVIEPIFLRSVDERIANILNPLTAIHDFRRIVAALRNHKPDVVIGMYVNHAYPLVFIKKFMNFHLFTIVSGGDLELSAGYPWRLLRRLVYSQSERIFTVAHKLQREIKEESGLDSTVIPTGTETNFFKPIQVPQGVYQRYGCSETDFVILTLSQLLERKRVGDVIRAFKTFREECPASNAKLIIAGEGPEKRRLMNLRTELDLDGDIVFAGFVSNDEKVQLFNIADVYVMASYQEGLPFSLMEGMSCGTLCLCSNVGDIPEVVKDGVNGFLVAPRNPGELARRIREIRDLSPKDIETIRHEARRTITRSFESTELGRCMISFVERDLRDRHKDA